jgi:hypothetical protein
VFANDVGKLGNVLIRELKVFVSILSPELKVLKVAVSSLWNSASARGGAWNNVRVMLRWKMSIRWKM